MLPTRIIPTGCGELSRSTTALGARSRRGFPIEGHSVARLEIRLAECKSL